MILRSSTALALLVLGPLGIWASTLPICEPGAKSCPPDPSGHCIWYGECGNNKFLQEDTLHIWNCFYDGKGKKLQTASYYDKLLSACPHFVDDFGPDPSQWELCCNEDQIDALYDNFVLPESILARCPTCLNNFKKQFCDLTCRPDHSLFMDYVLEEWGGWTALNLTEKVVAINETTVYLGAKYAQETFDSCKDVVNPATSGPALSILCGPWGTQLCTPERWFNYMGSTSNGYSPFDIYYELIPDPPGDLRTFEQIAYPCNVSTDGTGPGCSCTDCATACVPPEFPPPEEPIMVGNLDVSTFVCIWIFVFLVVIFVSFLLFRGFRKRRRIRKLIQ